MKEIFDTNRQCIITEKMLDSTEMLKINICFRNRLIESNKNFIPSESGKNCKKEVFEMLPAEIDN